MPGQELFLIQQLDFANGASGVREFPFDADTNNNTFHGTGTSGTAGATTNNFGFIAGVASVREPVFITMLRICAPPCTTITTTDLVDSLTWALDHQLERGGPGPINVSINMNPPNTFNTFPVFQGLAQSLQAQGDLVVNGAGNSGAEDSSPDSVGIRRVTGTDENNELASFSTYGPEIDAAAPATNIVVLTGPFGDPSVVSVSGTSISTAYWSGSIAFLQAACRRLNAVQADDIILDTATVTSPTGPLNQQLRIPNLNNALNSCP